MIRIHHLLPPLCNWYNCSQVWRATWYALQSDIQPWWSCSTNCMSSNASYLLKWIIFRVQIHSALIMMHFEALMMMHFEAVMMMMMHEFWGPYDDAFWAGNNWCVVQHAIYTCNHSSWDYSQQLWLQGHNCDLRVTGASFICSCQGLSIEL